MNWPNPKRDALLALALVSLTNLTIFARVLWNRTGAPEALLGVTERELALSDSDWLGMGQQDLTLQWNWRQATDWQWPIDRLDHEKLADLGFKIRHPLDILAARDRYTSLPPQPAWLVLEQDGATWNQLITDQQRQLEQMRAEVAAGTIAPAELELEVSNLRRERNAGTRLVVIDGGTDAEALRAVYPDRSRYVVMPGWLRLQLYTPPEATAIAKIEVARLAVSEIYVPLRLRNVPLEARRLARIRHPGRQANDSDQPRYRAVVAFGRGGGPWLQEIDWLEFTGRP